MTTSRILRRALSLAVVVSALAAGPALGAESEPAWSVTSLATPTAFIPGDTDGDYSYDVRVANLGADVTDGSDITIVDTLPAGLTATDLSLVLRSSRGGGANYNYADDACESDVDGNVETVTCTITEGLFEAKEPALVFSGEEIRLEIQVLTPGSAGEGETLTNHVEVQGGGAPVGSVTTQNETATLDSEGDPEPAEAGLTFFHSPLSGSDGQLVGGAGSHPFQMTTSFAVNTNPSPPGSNAAFVPAGGDVKNIDVRLPPGLIGSPTATDLCTPQEFASTHTVTLGSGATNSFFTANACPDSSAVGIVLAQQIEGEAGVLPVPLYNLVPPKGKPAMFGFQILNNPFYIDFEVRSGSDYGINATLRNLTQVKRVTASTVIVWGTPADPRHDAVRGSCLNQIVEVFPISLGDCSFEGDVKPSLRLPTSCIEPLDITMTLANWTDPSNLFMETDSYPTPSGCNQVEFDPSLETRPTTDVADSPSGLHADLSIPQNDDPEGRAAADLRTTVVTLPKGLVINPASANGLDACSPAQIGLTSPAGELPVQFTPEAANCPPAARIGSAEINTPLVDHPLKGGVYVAMPHQNPFNTLLAIYLAVDDAQTGVVVKLAGKVTADPQTGQLTTTFAETPQQPFDNFKLDFFGGPGAALRTPAVCGTYSTLSSLTPWSAPESGPPATPSDTYSISKAPGGEACATSAGALPNAPSFDAGTVSPVARAYSPMVINLRRKDGSQEFSSVSVTPPPGLLGRLAGVPYCPESALAQAAVKSGRAEQASPSCPAASQVGTVEVGAGAGPAPYYTQGKAYLSGPYKGAPLMLAIVTPAAAGPYDLGTVVSRVALHVDPVTAQITGVSDPIPHILQGIPLDVRSILVKIDRPGFMFNPTNCDPMAFSGLETSVLGQAAPLSRRFQVAECGSLPFKPQLSLRLKGGTKRNAHPALTATLSMPEGHANMARASVALPHSEFLEQSHIRTICTRVQFAARQCPAGSEYGKVRIYAPLFLDQPLEGPVYLRSSANPLPDLVAAVKGPPSLPVEVNIAAQIDSIRGGIRATFETVPDVPFTKAVVMMRGGKKGLLVNSRNICKHVNRSVAQFDAQNGKFLDSRPKLVATSCKKQKKAKMGKGKKHRSARR